MHKEQSKELTVTIRCLVYNHEPYLRQCLEGFVMQKTNFRFEAIVHDDASTDGSANIILEYAEKYPDIIKPIIETENQYSKRDGSLRRIMNAHTHGKYMAICEGDDYWTDPYKLQKQVDFLESNPEYTMCFANAIEHWQDDDTKEDKLFSNVEDRDYTGIEIYKKWIVPTASTLMRSSVLNSDIYTDANANKNFIYGDIVLFLSCAHLGKIRGCSDTVSVYRRCKSGAVISDNANINRLYKFSLHSMTIYKVFGAEYEKLSKHHFFKNNAWCLLKCFKMNEYSHLYKFFKLSISHSLIKTIVYLYKEIKGYIVTLKK